MRKATERTITLLKERRAALIAAAVTGKVNVQGRGRVMDNAQLKALVRELTTLPAETEWMEFNHNKAIPDEIGEYISALANSSAFQGKPYAYLLWGVEDKTHRIVGTSFRPHAAKVGNEELENWLAHHLTPHLTVHMHEVDVDGMPVVLFVVQPAPTDLSGSKEPDGAAEGSRKDSSYVPFWA